jgi:hypothetical protein
VIQIVDVLALQGVLVLRVRTTSADTDILRRLHEDAGARIVRELRPEPRDDLLRRDLPLGQRFQRDEHAGRVGRSAAAGERDDRFDARIGTDDGGIVCQDLAHRLERRALRRLDAREHHPVVLLREEALGYDCEQIPVEPDRHEQGRQHDDPVP